MAELNAHKIRAKAAKRDHDLHVALLMKREKLSKADAVVMAYLDGLTGLHDRLNPPAARHDAAKTARP